jgi:hypothetical protein
MLLYCHSSCCSVHSAAAVVPLAVADDDSPAVAMAVVAAAGKTETLSSLVDVN